MEKQPVEQYYDKKGRKQWRYYCIGCGKLLSDSAKPSENTATREETGNLLCAKCNNKEEGKQSKSE
jgi:hypothetical protein